MGAIAAPFADRSWENKKFLKLVNSLFYDVIIPRLPRRRRRLSFSVHFYIYIYVYIFYY